MHTPGAGGVDDAAGKLFTTDKLGLIARAEDLDTMRRTEGAQGEWKGVRG